MSGGSIATSMCKRKVSLIQETAAMEARERGATEKATRAARRKRARPAVGSRVDGRFDKHDWYLGVVAGHCDGNRIEVAYADGTRAVEDWPSTNMR
jgi:hypothetical protein